MCDVRLMYCGAPSGRMVPLNIVNASARAGYGRRANGPREGPAGSGRACRHRARRGRMLMRRERRGLGFFVVDRPAELGGAPMPGTPADFGKVMESEVAKWKKVVEFSGAT